MLYARLRMKLAALPRLVVSFLFNLVPDKGACTWYLPATVKRFTRTKHRRPLEPRKSIFDPSLMLCK